jgi:colicin import membrane protein
MTSLHSHISDLGADQWAALTRRAAADAVEAAKRRGTTPPEELVAVAGMTERQLLDRRARNGAARQRLSPTMALVEADHLRRKAEARAEAAHQDKLDAEAAAAAARVEADEAARAASAARAQLRTAQQQVAEKDIERTAERAAATEAHERAIQQLRAELEKVRADAAAEIATAKERAAAADSRADQRSKERTAAVEAAEKSVQQLRAELEQVRADSEAVVTAARERATAADARAQQRAAERTAATEAAEQTAQQLRGKLKQVRTEADAEIAAARGWAAGEAASVREAAEAEVARAYAAADDAVRKVAARAKRTLSMPLPPLEFRSETAHIENALNAVHQIDYMLEIGVADDGDDIPVDVDIMQTLARAVHEHAIYLCNQAKEGDARRPRNDEVAAYEEDAADAFRGMLGRIETVVRRLDTHPRSPHAEIVNFFTAMLADPWVQRVRTLGANAS